MRGVMSVCGAIGMDCYSLSAHIALRYPRDNIPSNFHFTCYFKEETKQLRERKEWFNKEQAYTQQRHAQAAVMMNHENITSTRT